MKEDNKILNLTFEFSTDHPIIQNPVHHHEYVISKQLLRSATSIRPMSKKQMQRNRKEFTQRMSISSKEARETKYWLRLLDKVK
jgi:four helix bundle protein